MKFRIYVLLVLLFALFVSCSEGEHVASSQMRSLDDDSVAFLVIANDWSLTSKQYSRVVACVWDDGYSVWSNDRLTGDPPHSCGHVDVKRIAALKEKIVSDGYLTIPGLQKDNLGPDSQFVSIVVRDLPGMNDLEMSSWHENWETNCKFVTLDDGPESIEDGKSRLEILLDEPGHYLHYRLAWAELRNEIASLIPVARRNVVGSVDESKPKNRIWLEK